MARFRADRVSQQIREEISALLQRGLKDPRIGFTTVSGVRVSTDLKYAKVFVSVLGDEENIEQTMAGLQSARGFIRTELARRLTLRQMPELTFIHDTSIEHGVRMSQLLDDIAEERQAREDTQAPSAEPEERVDGPEGD